eukprot:TRINITY_DN11059_c0_g1_i1.p1 TRINITY_DN11059_c0_g1~~TRINITY_DN11059_c0_g1_i1.p1  ORF type:complete len:138 (-),score=27.02 TRINITY_DN11059_c0_g1_i1:229-606(-)
MGGFPASMHSADHTDRCGVQLLVCDKHDSDDGFYSQFKKMKQNLGDALAAAHPAPSQPAPPATKPTSAQMRATIQRMQQLVNDLKTRLDSQDAIIQKLLSDNASLHTLIQNLNNTLQNHEALIAE